MASKASKPNPVADVICASTGAAITDTIFNPLELLKVRRQLRVEPETLPEAAQAVHRAGGLYLLWTPGLQATWLRAFGVTGVRVGLYPSVRKLVGGEGATTSFVGKAGAGMLTGALSAAAANPIDMVRTRIHAQVGAPKLRYPTYGAAVSDVIANEGGVAALWRGLGATVARQMLLSGGQLASYDQAKQTARETFGCKESPALHLTCAALSGVVAQFACMPADVIKVKILSGDHGTSVWQCISRTVAEEGMLGLYRGFWPAVCRQCPVILVQMPLIEQIRRLAGLDHI